MTKRIIAILLILLAAADLLAATASSSQSSFAGTHGPAGAVVSTPGTDVKKVEDKIADALAKMDSWKKAQTNEKKKPAMDSTDQAESSSRPSPRSTQANSTFANSTFANSTEANLTSGNSTLGNNSIDASSPAGLQNVGSNTEGRFKGYYGMTASRHEIGKSGINSHMFLSGNFEMDKAVKFQDQGID
ncbi:MAG: hypothetical protein A4E49_00498 [Methanosaeta sp. PtaU1.Bin112]|nr:MAG: hypothetical protein A4E49_00498 [Methanosaeta sp. PtaU1.Bin112]